ncbi:hypothetical protein GQ53DRAFT_759539 [Thozetella sp. PMI_491]|nr:hypothetical protein GQ53DRAFT_759539 [Thozetella sp. PMI_491]
MNVQEARRERRRQRRRVADEDRKRAPRACERCKRRKNRCIETPSGVCQRCHEGAHTCTFAPEKSILDSGDEDDDIGSPSQLPQGGTPRSSRADQTPQSIRQDAFAIDGVMAPSESFMWSSFLSRLRDAFCLDPGVAPDERAVRPHVSQSAASTPASPSPAEMVRLQRAVASFPPRDIAKFLVAVSIQHGTDSFFYVDQAQFIAELDHVYDDPTSRLRYDAGFVCLALAVFALGSQWTSLVKPDDRASVFLPDNKDPGRMFYKQARAIVGDIVDSTSFRSVQAAFVLGVYLMPANAIGASYVYIGLALRKALALDLHQNTADPNIGERETEIRRRLWWAIYSLERTLTIKLNRPASVSQEIITNLLPQPLDSIDSTQAFPNVQCQIANARLVLILDRLSEPRTWTDLQIASYEAELKGWKASVPPSLRLDNVHPQSSNYRAAVHLYLNYHFAWIAMGKVSVVTVVRAHLHSAFNPSEAVPRLDATVEKLSRSCIKSAKKVLQLFEGLKHTGNLTRFSFTDFQGCSLATTILLVAGIIEEDGDCSTRAAFGLDCLRLMTGGNNTAVVGIRFVEALQSIAQEAATRLKAVRPGRRASGIPSSAHEAGEFTRWAQWLNTAAAMESDVRSPPKQPAVPEAAVVTQTPQSVRSTFVATSCVTTELVSEPSEWERAAALQLEQMAASSYPILEPAPRPSIDSMTQHDSLLLGPDFHSSIYADDHAYLMGLTGLDVLTLPDQLD